MENLYEYKSPHILYIENVFIKDCNNIDDILKQKLLNNNEKSKHKTFNYSNIPSIFNIIDNWIKDTNIKCWYCTLPFKTQPVFIPKNIEPSQNNINIKVFGCFCSFSCSMSYINIHYTKLSDKIDKTNMLIYLYNEFYKKPITYIEPSPSLYLMEQYGGNLTISEYKQLISKLN